MNKKKLRWLLDNGWVINTITYKLKPEIKALGFVAFCHIQKDDDLIGFFV